MAMRDNRILVEVRMVKVGNATRPDGFERPRWCDRAPYTLQCLYEPWTHCPLPPPGANITRPGGRPIKVAKWPHADPYVRTGLGRIHRQGMFWHGARSTATREAGRFLFRPRKWVRDTADCVMRDRGLVPQQFVSMHIRHSVEKAKEGQKLGVSLPDLPSYDSLTETLSGDLKTKHVFLQTASPVALDHYAAFCTQSGLDLAYTNNSRSENDAWGGWKESAEMEQAAVGALNAYIGSQAAVSVSPELSLWTQFLAWVYGENDVPLTTVKACCPPAKCHSLRGGSHVMQVVGGTGVIAGGLAQTRAKCKVSG